MLSKNRGAVAVALLLTASAHAAHATNSWAQVPGAAVEIGVGPTNYPWILGNDQNLYYLDQGYVAPGCTGLCTPSPRWTLETYVSNSAHLAVDEYGWAWTINTNGELFWGPQDTVFNTCANSFAPQPLNTHGPSGGPYIFPNDQNAYIAAGYYYSQIYLVACGGAQLLRANFTNDWVYNGYYNSIPSTAGPFFVDTGEQFVTYFRDPNNTVEVPWIIAPLSGGGSTVWAFLPPNFRAAPKPSNFSVTNATDHYVVANNQVWFWNGDMFGNRGSPTWISVINAPAHQTIKQIAFASAVPGTAHGTVGPSQLWMIDTNQNIYYMYDATVPK